MQNSQSTQGAPSLDPPHDLATGVNSHLKVHLKRKKSGRKRKRSGKKRNKAGIQGIVQNSQSTQGAPSLDPPRDLATGVNSHLKVHLKAGGRACGGAALARSSRWLRCRSSLPSATTPVHVARPRAASTPTGWASRSRSLASTPLRALAWWITTRSAIPSHTVTQSRASARRRC